MATRVGRLKLKIPQVRHLSFYPKSLERGCRSEKALKLAIAEMYVKGVSTRKASQITQAVVWNRDLGHSGLENRQTTG